MSETADHVGPEGLKTRGTVLIVAGRGESTGTYQRLGQRLAADAYRVRVLVPPVVDGADLESALDRFAGQLTAALAGIAHDGPVRPLVLVGSDIGAAAIAALIGRADAREAAWWPEGVVLAGLPGHGAAGGAEWEDELRVRTQCPAHRAVLSADESVQRGKLAAAASEHLLDAAYGSTSGVPHLLLIGDADPLADHDSLARVAKALPLARLSLVHGGHHDVLNDLSHRTVAAEIVTFLEALRNEPALRPIVTVGSSAW